MMTSKISTTTGKEMMKTRVYGLLAALCFFLFSLSLGITLVTQDKGYYDRQLVINETSELTGLPLEDLKIRAHALREYLEEGDNSLIAPYFNSKEVQHMEDVHGLFYLKNWILVLSGLGFLWTFVYGRKEGRAKNFLNMALGVLLVFLVFIAFAAMNFDLAFVGFHKFFFQNDLWLLDPSKDLMIQMLPQSFFEGMALRIGLFVLFMEGVYLLSLWRMTKKS